MPELIELPQIDEPPRSGLFVDHETWFGNLTDDEIREGLRLGAEINIADDFDTGEPRIRGLLSPARSSAQDAALARARSLREALLDHGVRAVSIELQTGRPGTPNGAWYDTRFVAEMSHHTVSRPSQGNTPCLALVKRGRSDVPGPLCNGYMGYDLVYRIICMGWANHPGVGGPLTVAGARIPKDGARPYAWGTEFEGGLEPWTDAMHEAMARADAAILDWRGLPVEAHIEHSTWTDRKIDRLRYTAASGRARIRPFLGGVNPPAEPKPPAEPDLSEDLDMSTGTIQRYGSSQYVHINNGRVRVISAGTYGVLQKGKVPVQEPALSNDAIRTLIALQKLDDEDTQQTIWGYQSVPGGDMHSRLVEAQKATAEIQVAVQALAAKVGAPIDLTPLAALTRQVAALGADLAAASAESAALRDLLQRVADGQVTPETVADELAARLTS